MADRPNVHDCELEFDADDPDGYRAGLFRPGPGLGAEETGMSVYELPPGQSICPYHYEHAEEEWLVVVSGRPTLRTPGGEEELRPGDVAFFTTGPDGAHKISNGGEETARVLMFSTVKHPAVTVYPDSDKIGVYTGGDRSDDVIVRRSSGVEYFDGEPGTPA
jgi:uncharacterized cupin superfamily protein